MNAGGRVLVATLAGAVGIWATSALGFWQLRRAAAKETLQRQIDTAASAPAVTPSADALQAPATLIHQHLRFQGRWVPEGAVYLDNRPHAGQAGFYVLMPLHIESPAPADVIVNRGWTPRDMRDRTLIQRYTTPAGPVTVTGIALAEEPPLLELARPADRKLQGIWQNFDFDAYAAASHRSPLPFVLRQDRAGTEAGSLAAHSSDASDGLSRDWPDRGGVLQAQIDRHHGYAFQWFALAATLVALLLFRIFRVIRHARPLPS